MFLTENDYSVQIRTEILERVKNTDGLAKAELMAQAEMESYLNARYDMSKVFGATENDRNPIIVMYMIDIALYHLHSNISPRNIPELRELRYDNALKWLEMVAAGKLNPDLPTIATNDGSDSDYYIVLGSETKYSQQW